MKEIITIFKVKEKDVWLAHFSLTKSTLPTPHFTDSNTGEEVQQMIQNRNSTCIVVLNPTFSPLRGES